MRFFKTFRYFVASTFAAIIKLETGHAGATNTERSPNHKSPSKERRSMADPDSSSAPKPLIYDLLNRLNASFARVHRNMEALEQVGIFDPLMMQALTASLSSFGQAPIAICSGPCAASKNATVRNSRSHQMSETSSC
jgi:hypothetical protein